MNLKRGTIYIIVAILIIFSLVISLKYMGYAIHSTSSGVTIDTGITVNYDKFKHGNSTTQFIYLNDTELENIENLTLENNNYGKVIFLQNINLTKNKQGNNINVDINANISFNRIEINTSNLTNFQKPSKLYLYNLSFSNPQILRNGEVCSSSICTKISYSSGTLIFRVVNFSIYSAKETPSKDDDGDGEDGGGGGGGGTTITNLSKVANQTQQAGEKPESKPDKEPEQDEQEDEEPPTETPLKKGNLLFEFIIVISICTIIIIIIITFYVKYRKKKLNHQLKELSDSMGFN